MHRDDFVGSDKSFPLWQGYLKSYYEHYATTDNVEIEFVHTAQELKERRFDIVALSSSTFDSGLVTEFAGEIKALHNPVIILGGHHITTLPHTLNTAFNYGVMGEGEQTFLELINALLEGPPSTSKLRQIQGLVFHDCGDVVINAPRGEINPLDKVPIPQRSGKYPPNSLITSRGCHYRCTFCSGARYWSKVRYFSAGHVVEELKQIVSAWQNRDDSEDVNQVVFYDDLAVANRERLKEIVNQVEAFNINDKLRFLMTSRSEIVDAELAGLMKRMNVFVTQLGLESGTDRILKELKGKSASVSKNQNALNVLHKAGLPASGCFIIGYFDETREEIKATLDFILRNVEEGKLMSAQIATLTPIPGTPVWDKALERNLVSEDMDWNRLRHIAMNLNFYGYDSFDQLFETRAQRRTLFLNEYISENELKDIMSKFFAKYDILVRNNTEERQKNRNTALFHEAQKLFASSEGNKSVVIYGAGEFTQNLVKSIPEEYLGAIIGIVDRNPSKWGTFIHGIKTYSPNDILSLSPTTIIIGSMAFTAQIEKAVKSLFQGQSYLPSILKFKL